MSGSQQRILIADDEADVLLLCRVNLEFEGFTVDEASNGQEVLDRARGERPDLILLDVMMPVMDGWRCLDALRSDPELQSIPVVMLTAKVQEDDHLRGLASGAADYVTKPFHPLALVTAIRTVLCTPADQLDQHRREALAKLELFRRL